MPRISNCPICNLTLLVKFCRAMDKELGCKSAFGCTTDDYAHCISCPVAMMFTVKNLMDIKNLPIGEALRLSFRQDVDAKKAREILREALQDKKYYPKKRGK